MSGRGSPRPAAPPWRRRGRGRRGARPRAVLGSRAPGSATAAAGWASPLERKARKAHWHYSAHQQVVTSFFQNKRQEPLPPLTLRGFHAERDRRKHQQSSRGGGQHPRPSPKGSLRFPSCGEQVLPSACAASGAVGVLPGACAQVLFWGVSQVPPGSEPPWGAGLRGQLPRPLLPPLPPSPTSREQRADRDTGACAGLGSPTPLSAHEGGRYLGCSSAEA